MGQESGNGLPGCLWVRAPHKIVLKWLAWALPSQGSAGKDLLPSSLKELLAILKSSQSLGDIGFLPPEALQRATQNMAPGFFRAKLEEPVCLRDSQRVWKRKKSQCCDSEITAHHFYCVLLIRRESVHSTFTQREGLHKSMNGGRQSHWKLS